MLSMINVPDVVHFHIMRVVTIIVNINCYL